MKRINREDRQGYILTTYTGEIHITDEQYAGTDAVRMSARTRNEYVTVTIPLARHLRMLNDIFGYETIKRMIDNMPLQLRNIG